MMWSDAYRPTKVEDMVGNEEPRMIIVNWLLKWIDGTKPLLLIGPPGVGKTTIVKALANQFDYDLIEMNASDTRNKAILTETISPVLTNRSLFAEKTIVFLDEIDGIYGRPDSGGIEFLLKLIKEPAVPIIMAANKKDAKLKGLVRLCKVVEFDRVHSSLLWIYLNHVLGLEGKNIEYEDALAITKSAKGDIRSLLNITQANISGYNTTGDFPSELDISQVITNFFTSPSLEFAVQILKGADGGYSDPRFGQSVEERRKDIIYAFFSSIITSDIDLGRTADALDALSKCDLIVGRVSKSRHWTLLKYLPNILSYSLFYILAGQKIRYNQYSRPFPISTSIISRGMALRELISNLAQNAHTSLGIMGATYLPYLFYILHRQKVDLQQFVQGLNLDPETTKPLHLEINSYKN